jgi:hypothetical protein
VVDVRLLGLYPHLVLEQDLDRNWATNSFDYFKW